MNLRNFRALRGPNVWADCPVLEACIDLAPLQEGAPGKPHVEAGRLREWLPTLTERPDGGGTPVPLQAGASVPRVLERLVLELQRLAGTEVGFAHSRETSQPGVYTVACGYE